MASDQKNRSIEQPSPEVVIVRNTRAENNSWVDWHLLLSDIHLDSKDCNRALLREHLNEARKRKALVWIRGDFMDVMQGRFDPRRGGEEACEDYFDEVVEQTARFFDPWRDLIAAVSPGNHESTVRKNYSTNLVKRVAERLGCCVQPYAGFTRFKYQLAQRRQSVILYHHHGYGGEAAATFGTGQNRAVLQVACGARIFHMGHNHKDTIVRGATLALTNRNKVQQERILWVRTPGYAESHKTLDGWAVERGHQVTSLGGAWLRLSYKGPLGLQYNAHMTD